MADEQTRATPWRQGFMLNPQSAVELELVAENDRDTRFVVVVTQDCDIVSDAIREPQIEIIISKRIARLGADANAKTARRLHIEYQTTNGTMVLELNATEKQSIQKGKLLTTQPNSDWSLLPEGLLTLQKWLASRYYRAAFDDEFQSRMKAKGNRLGRKLVKALDAPGKYILAVFFDVDGGAENSRAGPDDVYQLRITLLYDSTQDEPVAYEATSNAAREIEEAFSHSFFEDGNWKNIQLLSCSPMSDSVMTVADSRLLKQWPLDHMSLDADPQQPTLK
jgi:hypothetical protein